MTLERCRRILCCGVRQENGRWPRRFQALLKDTTTTGRLQRLLPGATGAVACFVRLSKSTTTAPRFHRPPGRRPAGLLNAMVAQDARLRRAPARRTPGLRRKVLQRNGAGEPGASASNFILSIIASDV